MPKSEVQRINDRGLANGWHAQKLLKEAQSKGITMAELHNIKTIYSSASNCPAKCLKVGSNYIHYEFIDGSKLTLAYVKRLSQ